MPVLTEELASHWLTWGKVALTKGIMELQLDLLAQNKSHPSVFPGYFHLQLKNILRGVFVLIMDVPKSSFQEGWIWPFGCMPLGVAGLCKKQALP